MMGGKLTDGMDDELDYLSTSSHNSKASSSPEKSADKSSLPHKTKTANNTPKIHSKKNTKNKKSSKNDNDVDSSVDKTPKKRAKMTNLSAASSSDNNLSSSAVPVPRSTNKRTAKKTPHKKAKKKKSSVIVNTGKGKKVGSTTFTLDELLMLSKAYIKVSCNATHGTDKKADKFWDEIALHYLELVGKSNSINEDNIDYSVIDMHRNAKSLQNCWQC
jgi:hypothetical protein